MKKEFSDEIYAYALENAMHYGKAKEGAVLPKLFQHGLEKGEIKDVMPEISKVVKEVNGFDKDKAEKEFEKYKEYLKERVKEEKGLKELNNVKGKQVFRMAPFPSGSLHLGNMKTYMLNALYAEKYKGKVLLVIDDTIGSEAKPITPEAYDLIPEAFDLLKVKYSKPVKYKSDRLDIYYRYAEKLIKKDKAYVCSCNAEELRENRVKMKECSCRQFPVEEQIKRWKKMFKAREGDYTLRIKTSMQHPNPAFRDRVIFRISERKHARVGKKYKVWPLLEFSWAIDDHLFKVTHVIRGKELMIEGEMQKYIWDIFGWEHPELIYVGLVKIDGIGGKLSKSKSQKEVKSGEYSGWDDPRTWSVQSLFRRGILAESLREFVEKIGLNQKEITVPIDDLYAINRRNIDDKADRYFFVANPIKVKIENAPEIFEVKAKVHPERKKMKTLKAGSEIFVSSKDLAELGGEKVRLMHLYNIKLGRRAKFVDMEKGLKLRKIHWVCGGVKVRVMGVDGKYIRGIAEDNIKNLKKGDVVQFERFGFCRFDNYDKKEEEYEFWYTHD